MIKSEYLDMQDKLIADVVNLCKGKTHSEIEELMSFISSNTQNFERNLLANISLEKTNAELKGSTK